MPTDTFFRLPEEKRARILESAWAEFTRVPYSEVSINRIIQGADIPRGSFYQYFEDKEDLFMSLVDQSRARIIEVFRFELECTHGDPFAVLLRAYDTFFQSDGQPAPEFGQIFDVLWLNTKIDIVRLLLERAEGVPEPYEEAKRWLNMSLLKRQDDEYVEGTISLLMSALGRAVAKTMERPEKRDEIREFLQCHVAIVQHGAAAEGGIQ